jgi:hypothetical protein
MAKQPADRYPTAGAFARAARHALGVTSGERETVPPGSKRRRIAWIAGLVALVSLAAIVAIVAAADQDDDRPAVGAEPPGRPAAVKLDPETGAVEASIEGFSARSVPTFVGDLAAGEGGVWAGLPPLVHHLDPVTGTIRRSIPVPLPFAALAVGFRTVWVARPYIVERINPATDELLRPVRLEQPHGIVSASEIAVGTDAMWVATNDALYRIDPFTARVIASTDISGSTGLTVAYGTVWVVDDFSATLTAFDESNGKVRDSVGIPGSLDDVVAGSDSVWVLDHEAGVVSVVDPDSLSVLDTVRVGGDERDIVFGASAVWLADGSDRSVTRIDPVNMQTAHFEVAGEALHVTVDRGTGDLWVLVVPEA